MRWNWRSRSCAKMKTSGPASWGMAEVSFELSASYGTASSSTWVPVSAVNCLRGLLDRLLFTARGSRARA